jgi:hypothetical protein
MDNIFLRIESVAPPPPVDQNGALLPEEPTPGVDRQGEQVGCLADARAYEVTQAAMSVMQKSPEPVGFGGQRREYRNMLTCRSHAIAFEARLRS